MVRIGVTIVSAIGLISVATGVDHDAGCGVDDEFCEDERGALIQIRERGGMNVNKANKPRVSSDDQEPTALLQMRSRKDMTANPLVSAPADAQNNCGKHTSKILHEQTCKNAAKGGSLTFKKTGSWPDTPKGCYISGNSLYFNKHGTGGTGRKRTSLCKYRDIDFQGCGGGSVDEDMCKKGVKLFAQFKIKWGSSGYWKDKPYGCYVKASTNTVYFNRNPKGTMGKQQRMRICWADADENEGDDDTDDDKGQGDDKGKGSHTGKTSNVCEDRDSEVLPMAQKYGQSFTSCAQVKSLCERAEFSEAMSSICPKTCGLGACTKATKSGKYNKCEGWTSKITDRATCQSVSKDFGKWKGSGHFKDTPKGCYMDPKKKQVWFNAHATGGWTNKKRRISLCRPRQAPCADNDEQVEVAAPQFGFDYSTCSEVANMCRHKQVGQMLRDACPWTCGVCPDKPEFASGEDCNSGAIEITSVGHCQAAAAALKSFKWKSEGRWKDSPVGCYINPRSKEVFFNRHSTGGTKNKRPPVCLVDPNYVDMTPEPVCTDDDAGVQAYAETEGYPYETCADVANHCVNKQFSELAENFCPWTCGHCKGSKPEFLKAIGSSWKYQKCPDGTGPITGAGLCMVAARSFGWWKKEGWYPDTPAGCYQDPHSKAFYYNKHSGGFNRKKVRTLFCTVTTTTTMPYMPSITDIIKFLLEGKDIDMEDAKAVFAALEPLLLKGLRSHLIVDGVADVIADMLGLDEAEAERVGEIIADEITFELILKLKKGEDVDWGPILDKLKLMEDVIVAAFAEKLATILGLGGEETESFKANLPAKVIFDITESLLEGKDVDWAGMVAFFDDVEPIMVRVLSNQTLVDATVGRVARNLGLGSEAVQQLEDKVGDPIVREVLEQLKKGGDVDVDWAFMEDILKEAESFMTAVFAEKLKRAFGRHRLDQATGGGADILATLESLIAGKDVDMESALEVFEYLRPVLLGALRSRSLVDGVADVIANFFGLDEAGAERVGEFLADGLRKDIIEKLMKGEDVDWGPILANLKEMEDVLVAAFAKKLSTLMGLTDEEHENLRDNLPAQVIFKMTEDLLEGNDVDWSPLVDFFDKIEPTLVRVLSNQTLVDDMVGRFTRSLGVDAATSIIISNTLGQPLVREILDQLETGDDVDWAPVIDALNKVESYLIAAVQGRVAKLVAGIWSQPIQPPEPESEPDGDDEFD